MFFNKFNQIPDKNPMIKDLETLKLVSRINSKEQIQMNHRFLKMEEVYNRTHENFVSEPESKTTITSDSKSSKVITAENLQKKMRIAIVY